jgi:uncharacterized RDD family membrane protein YckC
MENIRIQTAQNVELEYEIAGIGNRIVAAIIDVVILAGYILALSFLSTWLFSGTLMASIMIIFYLPVIFYDLLCEIFMDGQSLGKRQMDIKVVRLDGMQPTIGNYLLRWLLRFVDIGFMYIGLIVMLFTEKSQRLGDLAAGTTVVKLKQRVTLEDTILVPLQEGYTPVFREVEKLNDHDMDVVRDVLQAMSARDASPAIHQAAAQAMQVLERKMGVQANMSPGQFLHTVIRDYNYYRGVV